MTGSQPPPPSMTATLEARAPTGSNYRARYPLTRATHEESSEMESPDCRDFLKSTSSTKMEAPACTLTTMVRNQHPSSVYAGQDLRHQARGVLHRRHQILLQVPQIDGLAHRYRTSVARPRVVFRQRQWLQR